MRQTVVEQGRPRGNKTTANSSRIERDIRAYELNLQGCSVRGVCEELGIKSTQTAHNAIQRGKQYVIDKGIDIDERRIEIDQLFANTLGMLAGEVARQVDEGRIVTIERSDGSREIRRTKGVDPRTAEALARSADRWGAFLGITDRANEVQQQATVIQLSAPADGASFADRWSASETVDVASNESKSESTHTLTPADASPALQSPTPSEGVTGTEGVQPRLF